MSFSGADPDALAAFAAQAIDAADALRPIDERLATVEALVERAAPNGPSVHAQVAGFAKLGRRTQDLGERVGTFGRKLRAALGGPSTKAPMAMAGVLFPNRADSPPRPVGWAQWSLKDRARYLKETDPVLRHMRLANPADVGAIVRTAGRGLVNGVVGEVDGVANTLTFGLAPDLGPVFGGDAAAGFAAARWAGTVATGVAAPGILAEVAPAVGAQTTAGFIARRGVDVAVGAASDASLDRHHTPGGMAAAGLAGGLLGGALDGAGQAYAAWRISNVEVPTISHGFDSIADWERFSTRLHDGLATAGYPEAAGVVQGSGATGRSFKTGVPFDVGRTSDLDVAIGGVDLLHDAGALGVKFRTGGMRTEPVPVWAQEQLGLRTLLRELSAETGRPVEIMIYRSVDEAVAHKPSIPLP